MDFNNRFEFVPGALEHQEMKSRVSNDEIEKLMVNYIDKYDLNSERLMIEYMMAENLDALSENIMLYLEEKAEFTWADDIHLFKTYNLIRDAESIVEKMINDFTLYLKANS